MATLAYPDYYSQTLAGNMFVGQSEGPKTGILIPISDTTSPTFGLWNPSGNTKNAVLVRFTAGFVGTTGAPGAILYNVLTGAGGSIATAAPISAFHATTPTNCLLGSAGALSGQVPLASTMKFAGTGTNTLTTAGASFATMGASQLTTTGATTSAPMYSATEDFNGRLIVPPGSFFYITGSAALLTLFDMSLTWFEV